MFHEVDSRRVFSVSFGAGDHPPVVGIAGSFANWEIWCPTFEILSRDRRVVGFDHDGVGETVAPPVGVSHEQRLRTLFSVLDAQQVDGAIVVGDSNNATVAIDAVLREPERFRGMVIVNGAAWGFDRPEVRRFVDALRTDFDRTVDFFVGLVFPEPDSGHLQRWLRDIIVRTGAEGAAAIVESYYGLDLRDRLAEVAIPPSSSTARSTPWPRRRSPMPRSSPPSSRTASCDCSRMRDTSRSSLSPRRWRRSCRSSPPPARPRADRPAPAPAASLTPVHLPGGIRSGPGGGRPARARRRPARRSSPAPRHPVA